MNIEISYDGNINETYDLLVDGKPVAEILTGEDGAIQLSGEIADYLLFEGYDEDSVYYVEIKNDEEKLGVIVDVFDRVDEELVDTTTYWFEDYITV